MVRASSGGSGRSGSYYAKVMAVGDSGVYFRASLGRICWPSAAAVSGVGVPGDRGARLASPGRRAALRAEAGPPCALTSRRGLRASRLCVCSEPRQPLCCRHPRNEPLNLLSSGALTALADLAFLSAANLGSRSHGAGRPVTTDGQDHVRHPCGQGRCPLGFCTPPPGSCWWGNLEMNVPGGSL